MEEDELLELAKKMAYQGKSYEEIMKAVQRSTTDSNAVQNVSSSLDQFIVEYQLAVQGKAKALYLIIAGAVFLVIGLGITVYTLLLGQSQYLLLYGAIIWGMWAIIAGYQKYKQPIENFIPRRIRIRRD